jgi:1-deoxy-D-xylulose-5-phosphate synthase
MIDVLNKVKDTNHPTVVHIHTIKGKGLKVAEENREMFHWIMPGTLDRDINAPMPKIENYDSITKDFILKKKSEGCPILAISPATPGATGFDPEFRKSLGKNYTDTGIAEEHAVAYASGVAKAGARPIISVLSSFIQRTYDQMVQDLALNNSPAVLLINWAGLASGDATHVGCFDIPLISNIPNIVYLAPTCKEEYLKMLDWATSQNDNPVSIRVPFGEYTVTGVEDNTDYSILNKFKVEEQGRDVAIVAVGNFFSLGKQVKEKLQRELNINATLINPKFISGLDTELLDSLKSNHKVVITLESGILDGGFGQKIASYYGNSDMKVLNFGAKKEFMDRIPLNEIYEKNHLTPELIVNDVKTCLNTISCNV